MRVRPLWANPWVRPYKKTVQLLSGARRFFPYKFFDSNRHRRQPARRRAVVGRIPNRPGQVHMVKGSRTTGKVNISPHLSR
jgi:hypothetical protein